MKSRHWLLVLPWVWGLSLSLLITIRVIIISPTIIMAADIIMGVVTKMGTIITVGADIVADTTTTADIATAADNAIVLQVVDMVTTTVETIIKDLRTTEAGVITAGTNRFFFCCDDFHRNVDIDIE